MGNMSASNSASMSDGAAATAAVSAAVSKDDLPPVRTSLPKTEAEWRKILTPEEFAVLRQKDTEPGDSRGYTKTKEKGTYLCKACDAPLYSSDTKFDSGCGWPAFWDGLPGAIKQIPDRDGYRIEIVCNNCGSHLGHVFNGERFHNPKDERHCVNSICLKLKKQK